MITIDETFVVSLLSCSERRKIIQEELQGYGIKYRLWFATFNADGAKGLKLTMRDLFEYALARSHKNILVLEDDATFINDPKIYLPAILNQLPETYYVCYLGCNLLVQPERVGENLLRLIAAYASHACIYSQQGMTAILNDLNTESETPYDVILQQGVQSYGSCYASYPMISNQRKGQSNIFKHNSSMEGLSKYYDASTNEVDWGKMMEDRFNLLTKNLSYAKQN